MTLSLRPDWQELAGRPGLFKAALLVLVVMVVLGLGYYARLHSVRMALVTGSDHGHRLHAEWVSKGQQARRFAELQAEMAIGHRHLQDAYWRLAAGGDMAELLENLSMLGQEQGLLFEQVDVLESVAGPGYRTIPLSLQVVGRYPALRLWLDQWLGQLRLLRVQQVRLGAVDGKASLLRMHLVVHAYDAGQKRLDVPRSLADEPARAAARPPVIDPFRRKPGHAALNPLENVALEQLEMVGSLARQGQHQALLHLAGVVHRVRLGDRVGRAEGRVARIDEHRLEVIERLFVGGQGWVEQSRYLALRKGAVTEITDEHEKQGDDSVAGDLVDAGDGLDTTLSG